HVREEFDCLAARLNIPNVITIPLSALNGDNVVTRSPSSPWYDGPVLLDHLETVQVATDFDHDHARLPVQYVIRPHSHEHHDHRSYAGTLAGGVLHVGDEVMALPSGLASRIATITGPSGPVEEAFAPMAISVSLADDIDLSRGDMLTDISRQPRVTQEIDATVCWMSDSSELTVGAEVLLKHTTRTAKATVTALHHRLDVTTLEEDTTPTCLAVNEIGRITLRTHRPLMVDDYASNSSTGSFILIDPVANNTVAAGMVAPPAATPNTTPPLSLVGSADRLTAGATLWFSGLSGSGKSTVAHLTEKTLLEQGRPAFVLDGDTLRHGLNSDLSFSAAHRAGNLRRLAHVAALMARSGQVVLVAAISPLDAHRQLARRIHADAGVPFIEVYMDTPIEVCEQRDPKGLYAQARRGEIAGFTGIDSPFEAPASPDVRLSAGTPVEHVARLIETVRRG
ncbi:MAG: adenylyl-sulfate kinase, partial [Streptomyces sp.]|uniref:adenylyl-sulfate kinase n=1 Tax=Streptomyces sp. TaxID=1931 RepID=UPI0025E941C0